MTTLGIILLAAVIYCGFVFIAITRNVYFLWKKSNGSTSDKKEVERIIMNGLHDKARSFGISNEEFNELVRKAKKEANE